MQYLIGIYNTNKDNKFNITGVVATKEEKRILTDIKLTLNTNVDLLLIVTRRLIEKLYISKQIDDLNITDIKIYTNKGDTGACITPYPVTINNLHWLVIKSKALMV